MENKTLKSLLLDTFSDNELKLIPEKYLNRELNLIEIEDYENYLLHCKEKSKLFKIAGQHRIADWEKGWSGDGVYYSEDEYNNLPYYFKNNEYIRLNGKIFKDQKGFAEVDILRALQLVVFKMYLPLTNANIIIEYGCGTGSNIQFLKDYLPDTYEYFGSDWAISAVNKLLENKILSSEKIFQVNYFDQDTYKAPDAPYIAFTNASLEQAGNNYQKFMDFLIADPLCRLGIHIEPIRELLDISTPLNRQSFEYEEKRGYLKNFMSYLNEQNLEIKLAKDFGIGSTFLSGYQVVIWGRK